MEKQFKPTELTTPVGRISYPHLFKAKSVDKSKPDEKRYSVTLLLDKKTVSLAPFQKIMKEAMLEKFGKDQSKWPKRWRSPIADGDKPNNQGETPKESLGSWTVSCSRKEDFGRPVTGGVDAQGRWIEINTESDIYPGCYGRLMIQAYAWEFAGKYGVSFTVQGVQKTKDGEAFGNRKSADEMFGQIEVDDADIGNGFGASQEDDQEFTF